MHIAALRSKLSVQLFNWSHLVVL